MIILGEKNISLKYFNTAAGKLPRGKLYSTFSGILISMKDFLSRNKVFLIVSLITILIVAGGIFLMSRPTNSITQPVTIGSSVLTPQGVYKTSGFANELYLPASESAKVTLVEFGDYECPACALYSPEIQRILSVYAGKIVYVFRNYPLPQHKNAPAASYAVEAAGIQGKYWQMHEKLFATQSDWASLNDPTDVFINYAGDLGLDREKFAADMSSQTVKDAVKRDTADGNNVRLTETPTFYVNGVKVILDGKDGQLEGIVAAEISK